MVIGQTNGERDRGVCCDERRLRDFKCASRLVCERNLVEVCLKKRPSIHLQLHNRNWAQMDGTNRPVKGMPAEGELKTGLTPHMALGQG